nr:MAG TPA: hypothetical protein [Caudoviricetes sp.]
MCHLPSDEYYNKSSNVKSVICTSNNPLSVFVLFTLSYRLVTKLDNVSTFYSNSFTLVINSCTLSSISL